MHLLNIFVLFHYVDVNEVCSASTSTFETYVKEKSAVELDVSYASSARNESVTA